MRLRMQVVFVNECSGPGYRTVLIALGFFAGAVLSRKLVVFLHLYTFLRITRPGEVGRFNFLNIHGTPCPSGERNRAPKERERGRETANCKYSISCLAATSNERRIWEISDEICLSAGVYIHVRCNEILNYTIIHANWRFPCGELKYLKETVA